MEAKTIRLAQAGDREALAAIVDEFTPTVLGAAYGLCADWDAAGDIAQEVFATMLVRIGDLRQAAALPGWLMAIVRSSARRHRRPLPIERHAAPAPTPEDLVVAHDDARRLRLAVEALPADLRLPMVLHYFAGRPLASIAELCGLPLSTVKQRMRVARTRLREGMDEMADDMEGRLHPDPGTDPTDVIRMYTAMRSGDVGRVASILDARPDLVDVREHWSRADSFAHRLPWTRGGGTPLLRAVERGDASMVRLLLERGADPNGACTCGAAESPLWVAAVQRETEIIDVLLANGAAPDPTAFAGSTALEVALARGYDDVVDRLVAAGASPGPVVRTAPSSAPAASTGIKALDLWCPLPERGLVHLTPGFGCGAIVLVGELSARAALRGRAVVWTGFVQAPTDLGDVHHGLAELGMTDRITVSLAPPTAPLDEQIAALDRGVRLAGDRAFLVVFAETGRLHAVDERLAVLAARDGVTLVVAPLDGTVEPPRPDGSPYLASIVFDLTRAEKQRWPAVSASSWSRVADPDTAVLADRARARMTDELDEYLSQPFFVAEPFMGRPGESVPIEELHREVARLTSTAT